MELSPPLGAVLDTDALEKFIQSTDADACVTFRYRDWTVTVHGDERVTVTPAPHDE